jgi:alpha-mannosidase
VVQCEVLERGPWRAALWVRLAGRRSRIDLTLHLYAGRATIEVTARALWNERAARLKLLFPGGDRAEFEVPGAVVRRGALGEVPGGRWVRVFGPRRAFGFATDALYNFNCRPGEFQATVVRASRYADNNTMSATAEPWRPATDNGELTFRFLLTSDLAALPRLAAELESPPTLLPVCPSAGRWPREGSLLRLEPAPVKLLAFKPAEDGRGWILRAQGGGGRKVRVQLTVNGARVRFGELDAGRIGSWRLRRTDGRWHAQRCDTTERGAAKGVRNA